MSTMKNTAIIGQTMSWRRRGGAPLFLSFFLASLVFARPTLAQPPSGSRPAYRSPIDVAYSPDGSLLAVADQTWPGLAIINPSDGSIVREVKLLGDPYHVVWSGPGKVLVAEGSNGTVAEVDATSGAVLRRIAVGLVAKGLAVTPDGLRFLTCDRASNKLVVVKLETGQVDNVIDVGREPGSVAISPNGKYAVVGNKLPRPTNMLSDTPAAEISIVTLATQEVRSVRLAKGTSLVRSVAVSPDGKFAYVTHLSPRSSLPVTQLDNGWATTNAMSIIDVESATLYSNFIFDRSGEGAANPWGVTINKEGTKLWVTLAGVRELASVDLTALLQKLAGMSPNDRAGLLFRLNDLHVEGIIKRFPLSAVEGTRGVVLSADEKTLAVAAYFSGTVLLMSTSDMSPSKTVALPNNPAEDPIRMGERSFYSALDCYQQWLSCASCHDEGRTDTLNWDLTDDGTGNPKQTKSHVYSSETPPTNVSGSRESALVSSRAGYKFIQFKEAPEDRVMATYEFMKSLRPEPSPFLGDDGQLTPDAVVGKKLFEEPEVGCSGCHNGMYFSDTLKHDVGTRRCATCEVPGPDNNPTWDSKGYDTPTLIEVWRSAPYLHLGTALTLKDVLTTENKKGKHGNVFRLTSEELDQLVAYVLQIGPTRVNPLPKPMVADAGASTIDAPSAPIGTDGGVPPVRSDASVGSTGGTSGSGSSGGGGASADAQSSVRGDASAQGSVKLTRNGFSCHVGKSPSSPDGFGLLLVGLAWLAVARHRSNPNARCKPPALTSLPRDGKGILHRKRFHSLAEQIGFGG